MVCCWEASWSRKLLGRVECLSRMLHAGLHGFIEGHSPFIVGTMTALFTGTRIALRHFCADLTQHICGRALRNGGKRLAVAATGPRSLRVAKRICTAHVHTQPPVASFSVCPGDSPRYMATQLFVMSGAVLYPMSLTIVRSWRLLHVHP